MGIRNLLAGNLRKSAGIMRFGNGLPRQCEHWLAMTGFFDSLTARGIAAGGSCYCSMMRNRRLPFSSVACSSSSGAMSFHSASFSATRRT